MSRRDDRAYKIIYRSKIREPESASASKQNSSRGTGSNYDIRTLASEPRTYPTPRPREHERDHTSRREYADTYEDVYEHEDGIVIVERSRRRSPPRYELKSGLRRRDQRNDHDQPSMRTSRTMPVYPSEYGNGPASVVESQPSRYTVDDNDEDDRPRGRRGRQAGNSSPPKRLRSCIRGSRDESSDRPRARARSVSFREADGSRHDVGNQFHERPGEEARVMGQYLRHDDDDDDDDDDLASATYAARRGARDYY